MTMPLSVDLTGLDRLIRRFRTLGNLDASPLMRSWERIIEADNRKGVLAGTDRNDNPMVAVTYRPKPVPSYYKKILGFDPSKLSARQRNMARAGGKRGEFSGRGPGAAGLNNNLTSSEYRYLAGPPLAPRRQFSRVITNLYTGSGRYQFLPHAWIAFGAWREVVNTKGREFLHYHFEGAGRLPRRDLCGVRPEARLKMRRAAIEWMKSEVRRRTR
jgi:hypothetical protein